MQTTTTATGTTTAERSFDGATFDPARDGKRLTGQLARVYEALLNGEWWDLDALAETVGGSEASVSARLRDLRKPAFGGFTIEKRNYGGGHWMYHLSGAEPR